MALKITKTQEAIKVENLIMVIFGQPGTGKSSLAFSANKPLLLDFDNGVHRTIGRKDCVQVASWKDVADLNEKDLKDYDTIIIDTVSKALDSLSVELIINDPKLGKRSGELGLNGYGALGNAFKAFLNKIRSFKKDIILIAQVTEDKDGEQTCMRIKTSGKQARETISEASDMIGYYHMQGKQRILDFNPTETHTGKNWALLPELEIPHLLEETTYLADLINDVKEKINTKTAAQEKAEEDFNAALELINHVNTASDCTSLTKHGVIQNNVVLKQKLMDKAKELNFIFDSKLKAFTSKEIEINPEVAAQADSYFEKVDDAKLQ